MTPEERYLVATEFAGLIVLSVLVVGVACGCLFAILEVM